ncbi:MAG: 4Fe-4S dicluster domain-containing protein [Verrucomicrobiae bacterium]|nr:4Fe-4S dicluster domain-containing protein [Verrucomicrobiae bacterium]MCP5541414.1 4Fe-4S dicluster domain-containing protein [Akkermansiaceae bacterium]
MLHTLQSETLGPHGDAMSAAVTACVHCGFCLPVCPTYRELGQEMDSPRGRIVLMKNVLEGRLDPDAARPHIERCLGCLACEPACPSGVAYRDLISPFRANAGSDGRGRPSRLDRLRRRLVAATLPYPKRFGMAIRLAKAAAPLASLLPKGLGSFFTLLPKGLPRPEAPPVSERPSGRKPRARVALLSGCAQQVLAPEINRAAVEVLLANGVEVVVPPGQGCCGALSWHTGDLPAARDFARGNLDAFLPELDSLDALVTTAAGCGSGLREYPLILAGTDREAEAKRFAEKTLDISVFLHRLGLDPPPPPLPEPAVAAYHDACHLANAQGVTAEPRALLRAIPNLTLRELPGAAFCCGSAGTYNLDQPEIAGSLGRETVARILLSDPEILVSGNIGCLTQIRHHLAESKYPNRAPRVLHTVELLALAYRNAPSGV